MDKDMKETEMTVENLTHRILADPEDDLPECDYYPVMDLVRGSDTEPGKWIPDMDAIQEVVTEYLQA